jgi:hypothetical protein
MRSQSEVMDDADFDVRRSEINLKVGDNRNVEEPIAIDDDAY